MNAIKKKALITSGIIGLLFFGLIAFEDIYRYIFILIFLATVVLWIYNFEVYKEKEEILHKSRFLILPVLFNLGSAMYLASFNLNIVRYLMVVAVVFANYYLFVALRRVHNLADRAAIFQRNIIISIAFLSVFFTLSTIFRLYVSLSVSEVFRFPQVLVIMLSGGLFYLISYFLAWENGLDLDKLKPYNLIISLLGAEMAWVSSIWVVNYPVFGESQRASLSCNPMPAIVLTVVFYFMWGIVSHKADKSLTKEVIGEYIGITLIFLFILLFTARWLPSM